MPTSSLGHDNKVLMNKDNNRVYGFLSVSENVNDSENKIVTH